jgi:hypothetical protein
MYINILNCKQIIKDDNNHLECTHCNKVPRGDRRHEMNNELLKIEGYKYIYLGYAPLEAFEGTMQGIAQNTLRTLVMQQFGKERN